MTTKRKAKVGRRVSVLRPKPSPADPAPFLFEALDAYTETTLHIFDADLRLVYANKLACEWLGRRREDIVGEHIVSLFGETPAHKRMQHVFATGEPLTATVDDLPNPTTGEKQSWRANYVPLTLPDGRRAVAVRGQDVTVERAAARRTEEERKRLLDILMSAPLAVAVYSGPQHTIEVMNQAYSAMFSGRFKVGQTFRDKGPDDPEVQKYVTLLDQVRETREPVIGSEVPIHYDWDGTGNAYTRVFNFVFQPVFLSDGSVGSIINFAMNITEFVEARELARTLERKAGQHRDELFEVLQTIPAACAVIRYPEMTYELSNRTNNDWLGKGNVIGRDVREVLPEFETQGIFASLRHVAGTGELLEAKAQPVKLNTTSGERELFLNSVMAPIRNLNGEVDRILSFSVDVTEQVAAQRRAELLAEHVEKSNQWLREVLNNKPTPTLLIEPKTAKVIFANKAADRMAGGEFPKFKAVSEYESAYVCTYPDGRRIPADEMPGARAARGEILEGFEMDWMTPLGKRTIVCHSAKLEAMFNYPETALVTFYDITELRQAQREAAEAVRVRDEYMSVASHELRTPLTSIMLQAEVLRQTTQEAPSLKALERIVKHGSRINQIITTLLDVSRISSGQVPLDPEEVDLGLVVKDAVSRLQVEAERAECPVTVDVSRAVGHWDKGRVEQVVTNLLTNAFKYGRGAPVVISAHKRDGLAVLSVRDFGIGIRTDDKERIFEQFQRVGPKEYAPGLGLGLWIVHKIVSALGGRIHVESAPNEGSTFIVELPAQAD